MARSPWYQPRARKSIITRARHACALVLETPDLGGLNASGAANSDTLSSRSPIYRASAD
jgi:hypothetical protein